MHALFHIRTVFIQSDRYRPEGQYWSRDDNIPDMGKGCIDLFITYFHIEFKYLK
jgi:hypothetical protein